ncbi:MAG: PEP-CTERM sorting domain-containing protein [Phycisphaerae bacterium]
MRFTRIMLSTVVAMSLVAAARAGPVTTFTDLDEFRAAAGSLVEIDFSLSPDGSPSPLDAPIQITPEFNYTDFGVTFSSHEPELRLIGHSEGGGTLFAISESGTRNWIEAQFDPLVYAVAITTGGAVFSIYGAQGERLAESVFESRFVGFTSDVPIDLAVIDGNSNGVNITGMLFRPVPEPVTLLLLGAGALVVARRRKA